MSTLYLVRHAHASWTMDENRPLSVQGSQAARRVADILCDYPISAIYSSPARRARQTIAPLAEQLGLQVHIEPDLRERVLGKQAFGDFFKAVEATWQDPFFAHPGGESSAIAQKRGTAVMQRLLDEHPGEHIVLSTHGNLMALTLQALDPTIDYTFWKSLTMPDIYALYFNNHGQVSKQRLWLETQ